MVFLRARDRPREFLGKDSEAGSKTEEFTRLTLLKSEWLIRLSNACTSPCTEQKRVADLMLVMIRGEGKISQNIFIKISFPFIALHTRKNPEGQV